MFYGALLREGYTREQAEYKATHMIAGSLHRQIVYPDELMPVDKGIPNREYYRKLNQLMINRVKVVELWLKTIPFIRDHVREIQKRPVYIGIGNTLFEYKPKEAPE